MVMVPCIQWHGTPSSDLPMVTGKAMCGSNNLGFQEISISTPKMVSKD